MLWGIQSCEWFPIFSKSSDKNRSRQERSGRIERLDCGEEVPVREDDGSLYVGSEPARSTMLFNIISRSTNHTLLQC